jgi:hypothetical protein
LFLNGRAEALAASAKLKAQFATNRARGAHQRLEYDASLGRVEQTVELSPAGMHQFRHARLCETPLFHRSGNLISNDAFHGSRRDFLTNAMLIKPALQRRADMRIVARHDVITSSIVVAPDRRVAGLSTLRDRQRISKTPKAWGSIIRQASYQKWHSSQAI